MNWRVFAALCLACIASMNDARARGVSDAKRKMIEKAYEKFQKKGAIPGEDVPKMPWSQAVKYDSYYYRIRTNTSRDVAQYVGQLMDAQAVALRKIFQFRMRLRKTNIWATRTRQDFVNVAAQELRLRISPYTGGFWTNAGGGTIVLPYIKAGNLHPGNVMMHEATHQFLNAALGVRIPIWLNEGIAVFFEESRYNPVEKKLEVFIVPRSRLRILQMQMKRDAHVKLAALFSTPQSRFSATHYGSAWSFVYWVLRSAGEDHREGMRRQKAFNRYLTDVKSGKQEVSRLFGYLGMKMEDVEKEWKKWVLGLDSNDERGGTRIKGEPPYEPKKRNGEGGDSEDLSGLSEEMRDRIRQILDNPNIPEATKKKLLEQLKGRDR